MAGKKPWRWRRKSIDTSEVQCSDCKAWYVVSRENFYFSRRGGLLIPHCYCKRCYCDRRDRPGVRAIAAAEKYYQPPADRHVQTEFLSIPTTRIAFIGPSVHSCPEFACSRAT